MPRQRLLWWMPPLPRDLARLSRPARICWLGTVSTARVPNTDRIITLLGDKLASALVRNANGQRVPLIKSLFNIRLAVRPWLVGTMADLSAGGTWRQALRSAFASNGWLQAQEVALALFAVLAWRSYPPLLVGVVLLSVAEAMTGRRLVRQSASSALGRAQADTEFRRARLDPLTQLPNRQALAERVSTDSGVGVLTLDLDHFKSTNDTFARCGRQSHPPIIAAG